MKTTGERYDITQCALYKCKSAHNLKRLLKLTDEEYENICTIVGYHEFEIDKKDGVEKRRITAPDKRIKEIQARVLFLLQRVKRPEWLISGEKGKCYIDNGKKHIQSNYFLTIDIKKFYERLVEDINVELYIYNSKIWTYLSQFELNNSFQGNSDKANTTNNDNKNVEYKSFTEKEYRC